MKYKLAILILQFLLVAQGLASECEKDASPHSMGKFAGKILGAQVPGIYEGAWSALKLQLHPILSVTSDSVGSLENARDQIENLIFPAGTLGRVDARNYDSLLQRVLIHLQAEIEKNGGRPKELLAKGPGQKHLDAHAAELARAQRERELKIKAADSTEGAKAALAKFFESDRIKSLQKNWKRMKKWTHSSLVFRSFRAIDGTDAVVKFNPDADERMLEVFAESADAPTAGKFPRVIGSPNTGRVVWSLYQHDQRDGWSFFCMAEEKPGQHDGYYEGNEQIRSTLETLFKDRDADIFTTEIDHEIRLKSGETLDELKALIVQRLTEAGAVRLPDSK